MTNQINDLIIRLNKTALVTWVAHADPHACTPLYAASQPITKLPQLSSAKVQQSGYLHQTSSHAFIAFQH